MATSVTLRQLEYFVASARAGTMAGAAAAMHVSAAAVSLGIAQLERSLGYQLFLRTHHQPLALTGEGRELLPEAISLVTDAEKLESRAGQADSDLTGTLYLSCFTTLAPFVVPRLLAEVGHHHPRLRLEIGEGASDDVQRSVLDGRSELAVLYGIDLHSALHSELIAAVRPYVVLPADHRLARRRRVRLRELASDPLIMLESPPSLHHTRSVLDAAGVDPPVERITHSFETLRALVARGHGWGVLVQRPSMAWSYEGIPVTEVDIADEVESAPVVAANVAGARRSRRAEACLHALRALFTDSR